jgi:hypothetical protein
MKCEISCFQNLRFQTRYTSCAATPWKFALFASSSSSGDDGGDGGAVSAALLAGAAATVNSVSASYNVTVAAQFSPFAATAAAATAETATATKVTAAGAGAAGPGAEEVEAAMKSAVADAFGTGLEDVDILARKYMAFASLALLGVSVAGLPAGFQARVARTVAGELGLNATAVRVGAPFALQGAGRHRHLRRRSTLQMTSSVGAAMTMVLDMASSGALSEKATALTRMFGPETVSTTQSAESKAAARAFLAKLDAASADASADASTADASGLSGSDVNADTSIGLLANPVGALDIQVRVSKRFDPADDNPGDPGAGAEQATAEQQATRAQKLVSQYHSTLSQSLTAQLSDISVGLVYTLNAVNPQLDSAWI